MATSVSYNNILLHNVTTRRFEQEILYDQSDTDNVGQRFHLAFEGILHAQRVPLTESAAYIAPGSGAGGTAVAIYDSVKRKLGEPRGTLTVRFGSEVVLHVGPAVAVGERIIGSGGSEPDVNNGPKPRLVNITHISGNTVFRVYFEIECTVGHCSPSQSHAVLNNRWSVSESMDSNFFIERRIDGRLRLAGNMAGHAFKHLVVPGLESGFKRDRLDFTAEEDGLHCTYSVVDKQVHTAAPWPATRMQARHSESTADGVKFISQIFVRLEGPPHVDKRLLIERAVQVADNRLKFIEQPNPSSPDEPNQLIEYAEITDYIGEEAVVEVTIRTQQLREVVEFLSHLREETIGTPLELPPAQNQGDDINGTEYNPRLSPVPSLYGYDPHGGERRPAVALLLNCYLQTPCLNVHRIGAPPSPGERQDQDTENEPEKDREETAVQEKPPGSLNTDNLDKYSDEARTALYSMSKIAVEYNIDKMKVAMPIARRSGRNDPTAATNVVFDLAEPQAFKRVTIDVERIGQPPKIAEPLETIKDGSLVATLKRRNVKVHPPVLTADGRHEVFRVQASYLYILNRPPLDSERLRIGHHPHTEGLTTFITPNELFESTLV